MTTKRKILAAGLILAGLVVTGFLLLSSRKSTPAFDGDLLPVRKTISDQDNAFPLLAEAAAAMYWPEDKARELRNLSGGKNWDTDFAAEVLARNEKTLALLERAMACAELQVPVIKSLAENLPYWGEWRNLTSLASIQAIKLFREGKEQEALVLALRIVHFGHHAENSGGLVIHYLAGSAIKQTGLRLMRQIAWKTTLPREQLMAGIARLETYHVNEPGLTNAFRLEYQATADFFEDFNSGIVSGTESLLGEMVSSARFKTTFNVARTKSLEAQNVRIGLRSIPRHFKEMPLSELFSQPTNSSMLQRILRHNATGEMLIGGQSDVWTSFLAKKCRENSAVSATQLSLALKCFHLKHSRLPDALTELVPEFLSTIPLDDFDGKPLRYSRERRLIWSVGKDLIDSGGVNSKKDGEPDDILFEIDGMPAPKP